MTDKVGLNGFGRIGRLVFREAWNELSYEIAHINDLGSIDSSAYLLKFDSIHGTWGPEVEVDGDHIIITDGAKTRRVLYTQHKNPAEVPWDLNGIKVVFECSGVFVGRDKVAPFFTRGVQKVIISAPVKDADPVLNVVIGCNEHLYDPAKDHIVTAASCTTNCLAPIVKVIHEKIGIVRGSITTVHNVTNTQTIIDAPSTKKDDLRRARSGMTNLAPTSTGSATAIALIFPELKGKLNGQAIRVPLLNASITDCVFELKRPVTVDEVNGFFKEASQTYLKGILGFEPRPLVSTDYTNDRRSSIIDALSTMVVDGTHLKICSWYDNEMGYSCRMVELGKIVVSKLAP